ncbi:hypothetical protein BKA62DRAFT_757360 [Auriculariales sp. MPI-PUGE-AT-0066]|nr:hypothetical protein BKA62DRAFT_757360 [Auriculariales sp. MPI-PUGE-AT-0066]
MAHELADEILRDIFALHLTVPDDAFSSTAHTSPFSHMANSSSDLLVVCKRWMRVATPLLYETVILRSTAQAQSLAEALKRNAVFGQYIRKLRCEGGFGASVGKIMRAAPHITDLCFTLNLWSEDRPKSMCDAMATLDVRRVVIIAIGSMMKSNAATRMVSERFHQCFKTTWTNLSCIVLPVDAFMEMAMGDNLLETLKASTSLNEVVLTGHSGYGTHELINTIASNDNVQIIRVRWPEQQTKPFLEAQVLRTSGICHKIHIAKRTNPDYTPMSNVPNPLRRYIWSTIFHFVLLDPALTRMSRMMQLAMQYDPDMDNDIFGADSSYLSDSDSEDALGYPHHPLFRSRTQRRGFRELMLVCKDWTITSFEMTLKLRPGLSLAVRSIQIGYRSRARADSIFSTFPYFNQDIPSTPSNSQTDESIRRIFQQLPNISAVALDGQITISAQAFSTLIKTAGPNLSSFSKLQVDGTTELAALGSLTGLQRLDLASADNFYSRYNQTAVLFSDINKFQDVPGPLLPVLQHVTLDTTDSDFVKALTLCELPALTTLGIRRRFSSLVDHRTLGSFLAAHGGQVKHASAEETTLRLVLEGCSNLTSIEYMSRPEMSTVNAFDIKKPHVALESVSFGGTVNIYGHGDHEFFNQFNVDKYPALKSFSLTDKKLWPTTQREIARSPWPDAAERLLKHGVRILDGTGVAWRPRLKTAQAKSQVPRKRKARAAQEDGGSDAERSIVKRPRRRQRHGFPPSYIDLDDELDFDHEMDWGWL